MIHPITEINNRERHEVSDKQLIEEQEKTFSLEDSDQPIPPPDIVAYNELRSCADLFRMYESGKLELKPDFQRDVVWKQDDQSRFIDSLVKQLPIPSMCFSLDYKTQKWKVIDGLQRMTAIVKFLGNVNWQLSDLSDTHPLLRKAINTKLRDGTEEERRIYAMVQDVSIPITVIRCDYSQAHHMRYLFTIFHRLNSGGVRLNNQEIRNCIYSGKFNDELKRLDALNPEWIKLKKRIWGSMDRFRSVEVLLRVLAFSSQREAYDGNLSKFLNDYMHSNMALSEAPITAMKERLEKSIRIATKLISKEPRGKMPLAKIESLLVGLYINIDKVLHLNETELSSRYDNLKKKPAYSEGFKFAVSSVDNVKDRLNASVESFE